MKYLLVWLSCLNVSDHECVHVYRFESLYEAQVFYQDSVKEKHFILSLSPEEEFNIYKTDECDYLMYVGNYIPIKYIKESD